MTLSRPLTPVQNSTYFFSPPPPPSNDDISPVLPRRPCSSAYPTREREAREKKNELKKRKQQRPERDAETVLMSDDLRRRLVSPFGDMNFNVRRRSMTTRIPSVMIC
ncbi:unnamed protein product [Linum trigynum]|uniref:Uncharacterized protein n=1 Tax=Linum trigynum TaxID=586398 RepID=A0AAV2DUF1_9ROSI